MSGRFGGWLLAGQGQHFHVWQLPSVPDIAAHASVGRDVARLRIDPAGSLSLIPRITATATATFRHGNRHVSHCQCGGTPCVKRYFSTTTNQSIASESVRKENPPHRGRFPALPWLNKPVGCYITQFVLKSQWAPRLMGVGGFAAHPKP